MQPPKPDHSEKQQKAGSRDDLQIDTSRCLRTRFNGSSCSHCLNICPAEALSLENGLLVNQDKCTGCLLCTSVCPSGALEQQADFQAIITKLVKASQPVLGCCRTKDQSNAYLSCLGGLSDEHLLVLSHRLKGTLILNLVHCNDCPNNAMLQLLEGRLQQMLANGLTEGGCSFVSVTLQTELHYQAEGVNRRSFFTSLRNSLFQTAAEVMQISAKAEGRSSSYADKRVPQRRELLNQIRNILPEALQVTVGKQFNHNIRFNTGCTACQGCSAICPTGALVSNEQEEHPTFMQERCTGCGLCVEFCLDQAIS